MKESKDRKDHKKFDQNCCISFTRLDSNIESKSLNNTYLNIIKLLEASSLDRIKMTKNWLEFDRKKLTTMNLNVGT